MTGVREGLEADLNEAQRRIEDLQEEVQRLKGRLERANQRAERAEAALDDKRRVNRERWRRWALRERGSVEPRLP